MDVSIVISAALACLIGGVLPWINSEVAVVGAAVLLPREAIPILVVSCTATQMLAKGGLYSLTRWAPDRLPERAQRLVAKAERFGRRPHLLVAAAFSGALVALPPFYLVTLACGTLRVPFALYAAAGVAGTAVRYGALIWAATTLAS